MRKSNVLRPQPHLSTLESSMGHRTNRVEGVKVITAHAYNRSSLPNHISCGTRFQPLTKDHGDDNHIVVPSAGSGGSQDLGRRPEMASAGFAMDRFVHMQKGFLRNISMQLLPTDSIAPPRVREYRRVRRRVRPPGARDSFARGIRIPLTIRRLRPRDGRSRCWIEMDRNG